MSLEVHRLFYKDVQSAVDYYGRERGVQLAHRFVEEIEILKIRIEESPLIFKAVSADLRIAMLQSFPYRVLFKVTANRAIVILSACHERRHPRYGFGRR